MCLKHCVKLKIQLETDSLNLLNSNQPDMFVNDQPLQLQFSHYTNNVVHLQCVDDRVSLYLRQHNYDFDENLNYILKNILLICTKKLVLTLCILFDECKTQIKAFQFLYLSTKTFKTFFFVSAVQAFQVPQVTKTSIRS